MKTVITSSSLFAGALLLLTGLFALPASAHFSNSQIQSISVREIRKVIKQEQKNCPALNCESSRLKVENLSVAEYEQLGNSVRKDLRKAARDLALDIWPDTILEGPYHSVFRVRMEKIQRLSLDGAPLGYRVSFSDKAWNTDNCPESSDNGSSDIQYRTCETGRIYDAGFVMENLKTSFRDESVRAEFRSDVKPTLAFSKINSAPSHGGIVTPKMISIPTQGISCEKKAVENRLVSHLSLIANYIEEERGLYICDEQERSRSCYEESSLVTLLSSLIPEADSSALDKDVRAALGQTVTGSKSASFVTDRGYDICDHNSDCRIQFRVNCSSDFLSIQEM